MKINAQRVELESALLEFKSQFKSINEVEIESKDKLTEMTTQFRGLKQEVASYLKTNAPEEVAPTLSQWIRDENRYNLGIEIPFDKKVQDLKDRALERARTIDSIISYLPLSDSLNGNVDLARARENWTIDQKADFILWKLYEVRKVDNLWNIPLLFILNDIQTDSRQEAKEIIRDLASSGFVEKLDLAQDTVLAKIITSGIRHVQNSASNQHDWGAQEFKEDIIEVPFEEIMDAESPSNENLINALKALLDERFNDLDSKLEEIASEIANQNGAKSKDEIKDYLKDKFRDMVFDTVFSQKFLTSAKDIFQVGSKLIGGSGEL